MDGLLPLAAGPVADIGEGSSTAFAGAGAVGAISSALIDALVDARAIRPERMRPVA